MNVRGHGISRFQIFKRFVSDASLAIILADIPPKLWQMQSSTLTLTLTLIEKKYIPSPYFANDPHDACYFSANSRIKCYSKAEQESPVGLMEPLIGTLYFFQYLLVIFLVKPLQQVSLDVDKIFIQTLSVSFVSSQVTSEYIFCRDKTLV